MNTTSKTVLITGANKGIGYGISQNLLSKGYRVILTSRDEQRGISSYNELKNKLKNDLIDVENNLLYHQLDIDDENSLNSCILWIKEKLGQIDILVANAAIYFKNKSTLESLDPVLKTNVFSTINSTEKFIEKDLIRKNGKIVLIGSIMGTLNKLKSESLITEFQSEDIDKNVLLDLAERYRQAVVNNRMEEEGWISNVYSVSKMIINTYSRVLAKRKEIQDRNIGAYSVHPGWVKTDMGGSNADLTLEEGIVTPVYVIELQDGIIPELQGKFFDNYEVSSLVYDLGTFACRVGYSGEDTPKCVVQPYIGINKQGEDTNYYVSENQLRFFREGTKVHNIVNSNGYIENFDYFEKLTDEIFSEYLRIDPKEHPILFTEPSLHNKENRLKLTELMFEKYGIPAMFICKSSVLSAFSCGRSTCLVFDSGHSTTYAVPVHDGYALQKSMLKFDIAGNWVTSELQKLIEGTMKTNIVPHYKFTKFSRGEQFITEYLTNVRDDPSYEQFWKREILRDFKENCLSVGDDQSGGSMGNLGNIGMSSNLANTSYELPDGRIVELGEERTSILEKLFYPIKEVPGFFGYHQMILDAISKGDVDIRKEMSSNIFVCGGNTLFSNFPERLQKQLFNASPQALKIKLILHPSSAERKFSSWIGGSILSSLGTFHQLWLSKIEYEEHGAMIIERKCA